MNNEDKKFSFTEIMDFKEIRRLAELKIKERTKEIEIKWISKINQHTSQDNNPRYMAYAIEYTFNVLKRGGIF